MKRLKKVFSILFLVGLLFPSLAEAVHCAEHAADTHCTETSDQHFHVLEHHCPVCDFIPGSGDAEKSQELYLNDYGQKDFHSAYFTSFVFQRIVGFDSLRAPPLLS